jgi:hypothetical protein
VVTLQASKYSTQFHRTFGDNFLLFGTTSPHYKCSVVGVGGGGLTGLLSGSLDQIYFGISSEAKKVDHSP